MRKLSLEWACATRGATAIEYALISGLIAVVVAGVAVEIDNISQRKVDAITAIKCPYGPAEPGEEEICAKALPDTNTKADQQEANAL